MRPVAVSVGSVRLTGGEVFAVYNARSSVRPCQIAFRHDAAVDHGNAHTCAIPTVLPGEVRIDRCRREVEKFRRGTVRRDVLN